MSGVATLLAYFTVVYVIIEFDLERLNLFVIVVLEPKRSRLGYQDAVSCWPLWFGLTELSFLCR